jgi:hypothetical protein
MGYGSADDLVSRFPTIGAQLAGPVLTYLYPFKPFPTEQSLYMAVFYPAARSWPPGTAFSPAIQAVNPGIRTVADYVSKVNGTKVKLAVGGALILAAVGALAWYTYTTKSGGARGKPWDATRREAAKVQAFPEGVFPEAV